MARADVLSRGDMTYSLTLGRETVIVILGNYIGDPILVNGSEIGRRGADDTDDCMRVIARHRWGTSDGISYEAQELTPFLIIDTDRGCPHACTELTVRVTSLYFATQMICPRTCIDPVVDIHWRAA